MKAEWVTRQDLENSYSLTRDINVEEKQVLQSIAPTYDVSLVMSLRNINRAATEIESATGVKIRRIPELRIQEIIDSKPGRVSCADTAVYKYAEQTVNEMKKASDEYCVKQVSNKDTTSFPGWNRLTQHKTVTDALSQAAVEIGKHAETSAPKMRSDPWKQSIDYADAARSGNRKRFERFIRKTRRSVQSDRVVHKHTYHVLSNVHCSRYFYTHSNRRDNCRFCYVGISNTEYLYKTQTAYGQNSVNLQRKTDYKSEQTARRVSQR